MLLNNTDEFKKRLEEGWRISSKQIPLNINKAEEKVIVKLEKGKDVMEFTVINDNEFMSHIIRYRKFPDVYGNVEFLYVENYEEYQKALDSKRKKGKVSDKSYKIILNDLTLNDCNLYHLERRPINQLPQAYFFVKLSSNEDLIYSDFRDEINIFFTDTNEKVFSGYIHKAYFNNNNALFMCQGGTRRLSQERLTANAIRINPMDLLYYVGKSGGINIKIHGKNQPDLNLRTFKVIFIIEDLEIDADLIMNDIKFTNVLHDELFEHVKKADIINNNPWSDYKTVAVCNLVSDNYYDALMKGYELIHQSINWLQFRTDFSRTGYKQDDDINFISYIFLKSFSRFKLTPHGVVMDLKNNGTLFVKINEKIGHPLKITNNPDGYIEPLTQVIENLNAYTPDKPELKNTYYQSLNWMMFSFEEENILDNLLQLWVSFEFLCSGIKTKKTVTNITRKKIFNYLEKLSISDEESKRIIAVINRANEPSLMMKWDSLLNQIGVCLKDSEKTLLKELRQKRNNLIHGRLIKPITKDQIEKFRSILEHVLIYKISSLNS